MAFRITATSDDDKDLLNLIRDLAWQQRESVSEMLRQAMKHQLYGAPSNWPKGSK